MNGFGGSAFLSAGLWPSVLADGSAAVAAGRFDEVGVDAGALAAGCGLGKRDWRRLALFPSRCRGVTRWCSFESPLPWRSRRLGLHGGQLRDELRFHHDRSWRHVGPTLVGRRWRCLGWGRPGRLLVLGDRPGRAWAPQSGGCRRRRWSGRRALGPHGVPERRSVDGDGCAAMAAHHAYLLAPDLGVRHGIPCGALAARNVHGDDAGRAAVRSPEFSTRGAPTGATPTLYRTPTLAGSDFREHARAGRRGVPGLMARGTTRGQSPSRAPSRESRPHGRPPRCCPPASGRAAVQPRIPGAPGSTTSAPGLREPRMSPSRRFRTESRSEPARDCSGSIRRARPRPRASSPATRAIRLPGPGLVGSGRGRGLGNKGAILVAQRLRACSRGWALRIRLRAGQQFRRDRGQRVAADGTARHLDFGAVLTVRDCGLPAPRRWLPAFHAPPARTGYGFPALTGRAGEVRTDPCTAGGNEALVASHQTVCAVDSQPSSERDSTTEVGQSDLRRDERIPRAVRSSRSIGRTCFVRMMVEPGVSCRPRRAERADSTAASGRAPGQLKASLRTRVAVGCRVRPRRSSALAGVASHGSSVRRSRAPGSGRTVRQRGASRGGAGCPRSARR